jgi:hypothetical protein
VDASLIAADANKQRSVSSAEHTDWRSLAASRRAVREYLDTLDQAAWGAASETVPKFVSPADPAAQWTGAHKGHAFFAYADNYLIDLKTPVIVDVEATRAIRQAEVGAARTMIDRTADRFGLKPERLAADSAYGSAPSLDWLVKTKGIAPHIPVLDKSRRDDGTFSRSDFQFDEARNIYVCPAAKTLTTRGTIVSDDQVLYRASKFDCTPCPLKSQCCPKEPVRKIPRSIFEQSRIALEMIGPFPGTLIRRSQPESARARAPISADSPSMRSSSRRQSPARSSITRAMRGDRTSGGVASMRGNSARKNRCPSRTAMPRSSRKARI